jgi:hypothetical protein
MTENLVATNCKYENDVVPEIAWVYVKKRFEIGKKFGLGSVWL